jgi:hypothetical protein
MGREGFEPSTLGLEQAAGRSAGLGLPGFKRVSGPSGALGSRLGSVARVAPLLPVAGVSPFPQFATPAGFRPYFEIAAKRETGWSG